MAKSIFQKSVAIIFIIIAAFAIRIWKLDQVPVSLFGDELDAGYHAYSILKTGRDYQGNFMPLHFHSLAEYRTPLFIYAMVPTIAIFGIDPWGVRLPSVFFGVLGVWGIYLLFNEFSYTISTQSKSKVSGKNLGVWGALFLALSPWHIQYSRAGFEVSMLLAFFLFGLYFFFRSLRTKGELLWMGASLLTFTPWIYSTAKLFTPLLFATLFVIYGRKLAIISKTNLIKAFVAGLIVGLPIAYSTIFGGGAERARYTSVFTDPTVEHEVGTYRDRDAAIKDDLVVGRVPTLDEKIFHNKYVIWGEAISKNFFKSFSFDFLFVDGDPYLRHSPKGVGEFYQVEVLLVLIGIVIFFSDSVGSGIKKLIIFWLIFGALPSSLTRDGGNHATRLILILPPLIFLMAYGADKVGKLFSKTAVVVFFSLYYCLFLVNFVFYLHNYFMHYAWDSEKWWHAGYEEAITEIKKIDEGYDRVIISMSKEPAWIFFAGWYEYDPKSWQEHFPINNSKELFGFGKVTYIDKFNFGSFSEEGGSLYNLGKYLKPGELYLANRDEISPNLIMEPGRTPPDLKLIKAIAYPSGEPAFYLFTKNN